MTRLGLRVVDFVTANPGLTLEEIARAIQARTSAVRDVLVGEGFSSSLRMAHPSDRAKVYRVVVAAKDGPGRVSKPSQCEKVSQVLIDGHWHTAAEIHRRCGFMRLNSRIAELRSTRRWTIVCEHIKGAGTGAEAYRYRLVGTSDGDEVRVAGLPAPAVSSVNGAIGASSPSDASTIALQESPGASDSDHQLSLSEAA